MGKYSYSLERVNVRGQKETLSVQGCDSFDEAIKVVEKGAYDRELMEAPARAAQQKSIEPRKSAGVTGTAPSTATSTTAPAAVPDMIQPLDGEGRPLGDPIHPNKDDNNKQPGE